jgi:uncharacterized protein Yka (UPF0111/DUF47 family)
MMLDLAAQRLEQAHSLVSAIRQTLKETPETDLQPLLAAVETACNAVAGLAPADARGLLGRVVALLDDVEALERDLDTLRQEAGQRLKDMARTRQANEAYGDNGRKRR